MKCNCKNQNGDCIEETRRNRALENDAMLVPMQPGKGLTMFSIRLSKFCLSPDTLYEVPKGVVIPRARPDDHRLSFVDDPPYSATVGKRLLRKYQIPNCKGCVDNFYKAENDISLNSGEIVLLREKLPKWIHVSDFLK